jgi:ABC-2 type transport system ATP-binding protein
VSVGVRDLVVRYGDTTAVAGVTFAADPGTMVALVGGDGAGKSSVLRALVGAVPAAGGTVDRPAAAAIGYVPGAKGVYADLTTQENLRFAGRAYGVGGERLRRRIDDLLETTRLTGARDRLAGALSGGMRQKLALACALLHAPDLLALDEATTGVDPVSRGELWRIVARATARGTTVVFASTYLDEAERAGHVVALDAGRVLIQGTPSEIVATVPGQLREVADRPEGHLAYRRGRTFRVWDRAAGADGAAVRPDLHDAVTVAALQARGLPIGAGR